MKGTHTVTVTSLRGSDRYTAQGTLRSEIAPTLPAVESMTGKAWGPIRQAVAEVAERRRSARAARQAADEIRDQERGAEAADRDALARAIRAGKDDPGPTNVEAWRTAKAAAERRLAAEIEARSMAEHDLAVALRTGRDDLLADTHGGIVRQEESMRAALAELTAEAQRLAALRSLHAFIASEGRTASGPNPATVLLSLPKGGGSFYTLGDVEQALRAVLTHEPAEAAA